ncbi:GTPase IMAP family member 8-like [Saccostrea cucullata]|uniref:GTPase IMAP family member 8-like n=1 Tax=Saccostrea cuccullata TaxID=36930 RepID=UPI002ED34C5C
MYEERFIIIGGIGAGKSTTGNIILGRKAFDANTMSDRVTKEPATESATRFNRKVSVVDTPGFDASNRIFNENILRKLTSHCSLRYRAIILVLRIQEFETNEKIVTFLNDVLPKDAYEHLIIIFSNIAALEKNDETIEGNLESYPESSSLHQLLARINHRYVGLKYYSEINRENTEKIASKILKWIDTLPTLPICLCFSICAKEQPVIKKEDNQVPDKNELRLILIGKTGVGKSSTGNSILEEAAFPSKTGPRSTTKVTSFRSKFRFDRYLVVVDTPGLNEFNNVSNAKQREREITSEVTKSLMITSPGPHAFILVMEPGRFTPEDQETISCYRTVFGEEFEKYAVVLFTNKDRLEKEDISIDDWVRELEPGSNLKELIEKANNRYLIMDYNKKRLWEQRDDVKKLLNIIKSMDNKIPFYKTKYSEKTEIVFNNILKEFQKQKYFQNGVYVNPRDEARKVILKTYSTEKIQAFHDEDSSLSSYILGIIAAVGAYSLYLVVLV